MTYIPFKTDSGLLLSVKGTVYKILSVLPNGEVYAQRMDENIEPIPGATYHILPHELEYEDTRRVSIDLQHFARTGGEKRIYNPTGD